MRRLISDAVQVKPPLSAEILLIEGIDPDRELRHHLPTESEVRDAMLLLATRIRDMVMARTAGQEGWSIGDLDVQLQSLDLGEVLLRGQFIIERDDA